MKCPSRDNASTCSDPSPQKNARGSSLTAAPQLALAVDGGRDGGNTRMIFAFDPWIPSRLGQRPRVWNARPHSVRLGVPGALLIACGPVSTALTGGGSAAAVASVALPLSSSPL